MRGGVILGACVVASTSCLGEAGGSGQANTASAGARDTISVSGLDCAAAERIKLRHLETYGVREGAGGLGDVRDLAVDPAGRVHVLDEQNLDVKVFDRDGRFVGGYGGEGDGPGEFRLPTSIDALADGRMAVGSRAPARLSFFDSDGRLLSDVRLSLTSSDPGVANIVPTFRVLTTGDIVAELITYATAPGDGIPVSVVVVASDGAVRDTLVTGLLPPIPGSEEVVFWQPHWLWSIDAEGRIVTSPGSEFVLDVYEFGGRPGLVIRADYAPVVVTASLREELREGYLRSMRRRAEPREAIRQARDRLTLPASLPAVFDLLIDSSRERIWVESVDPGWDRSWPIRRVYYLVSFDGRFEGCVAAPAGFHLVRVQDDVAYGTWTDDLDIPYVRSYVLDVVSP